LQVLEDLVGHLYGEDTLSFQYIMKMRLAYSGNAGEPALSGFAALYPVAQMLHEVLLKLVEGHVGTAGVFPSEIGY